MLKWLFGSRANRDSVEHLYSALMQAARHPLLYTEGGVPDTLEGRFDCLTLHIVLVLRRLQALPAPAKDLAGDLVDRVFAGFDQALREIGVGDVTIPKRMKTMAAAFAGRAKAYEKAFADGPEAFSLALSRNLLANPLNAQQEQFWSVYVQSSTRFLDGLDFASLIGTATLFPSPESVSGAPVQSGDRG